jgi:hypothetical protein
MAVFDFGKVKATISALASELTSLRSEREALLQKREELEGAPACKADLLQLLDAWIDRRGADFPAKLETGVSYYFRHPLACLPESIKAPTTPMAVLAAVVDPNGMATLTSFEASLFFVLRDSIKAGVRQAVESMDFTAAGPPRVERLESIAEIDARINALDKMEEELVSQAEASGLRV